MSPRTALLVTGDLTVSTGAATWDLRGVGDRVEFRIHRWRDAFALFRERRRASGMHGLAAAVGLDVVVFVRGIRVPRWMVR